MKNKFNVTTVLPHNLLQTNPWIHHNFSTQVFRKHVAQLHYVGPELHYIFWRPKAFWRLVSKSCDECKGLFARGCEAKWWSHWTCSSLRTIFQPVRINSVPDVKCFGLLRRPEKARKCSAAQGLHSEVVPRAFWGLVSKSCDECKGSFARGCEAKRWSHWTCSSLGTIFQPRRINSVPDVKCFSNNKNVLRAQSMVWHFVPHPVYCNHSNISVCIAVFILHFLSIFCYCKLPKNILWSVKLQLWKERVFQTFEDFKYSSDDSPVFCIQRDKEGNLS